MGEGVYTMVDPKTGRQVIDSHTGKALYGGQVGTGKNFSINSTLGKWLLNKDMFLLNKQELIKEQCVQAVIVF